MSAADRATKYAAICLFLLGAIACVAAAIAQHAERKALNPVMDQRQLLGQPAMGHAGRPWLFLGPNSGFDSRDGGHR